MTRRERHARIINSFEERSFRWERDGVLAKMGLAAFSDDAIELFAGNLVRSRRRHQKMNRENRARAALAAGVQT